MKTFIAKKDQVDKAWFIVDAEGKVLGRLASEIARRLRGKHKPTYTPHTDTGDFIVVVNAEKIALTGNKAADKMYYHHTGYPGGIKSVSAEKLLQIKPEELLRSAVKGMLPKNTLGRAMLKKLKIYKGAKHPHEAQVPKKLEC
jgi:large subunit ribosomal protein L13